MIILRKLRLHLNQLKSHFIAEKYKKRETYESKYSAEEKVVEDSASEDEEIQRTVSERREKIEKRLTRTIPASTQRVEIVEEITNIKRQSLVEDKIAEVEQKAGTTQEPITTTTSKGKTVTTTTTTTTILPTIEKITTSETIELPKTTLPSNIQEISEGERLTTTTTTTTTKTITTNAEEIVQEKPDTKKTTTVTTVITKTSETLPDDTKQLSDKRDTELLQSVSEKLETDRRIVPRLIAQESGKKILFYIEDF